MSQLAEIRKKRGLTQAALGELVGVEKLTIWRYENGAREPNSAMLRKLATVLDCSVDQILGTSKGPGETALEDKPAGALAPNAIPGPTVSQADVERAPVFASAHGSDGEDIVAVGEVVEYRIKPAAYQSVRDLYAFYVVGDSMSPRIEPGEMVWVNPHRIPKPGDEAVFIERGKQTGETRVLVKRLTRATSTDWYILQFNPMDEFSLSKQEWDAQLIVDIDLQK